VRARFGLTGRHESPDAIARAVSDPFPEPLKGFRPGYRAAPQGAGRAMPSAWGWAMTRHPRMGAACLNLSSIRITRSRNPHSLFTARLTHSSKTLPMPRSMDCC